MPTEPEADLVRHLVRRGLLPGGTPVEVRLLSGGVSADVFLVTGSGRRLVAKRALDRLRVRQEWHASPARVLREADALALARAIRPDNVPELLDVDEERLVITMRAVPATATNWKADLLAGTAEAEVGRRLGLALADWHSTSASDPGSLEAFADATNFFELRISPFFLRVAEVHADLRPAIERVVARLTGRSSCLVHGDFSPKNVLVEGPGFWVVDWETAHRGDPTFDLAFLVSHLVCKAVHRPALATSYRACADAFVGAYLDHSVLDIATAELIAEIGCLVLARVDGTSPVDYLDADGQAAARALARRVLLEPPDDLGALWSAVGTGRLGRGPA